ncbi:MAG: DUF2304 family protein [Alphaproteobacteria bacterium]|nr:DUF2304 family protein [Alphaproteobacteria bacterium]
MRILFVLALAVVMFMLIRRRLIDVDLSLPWMLALVVLGFTYNSYYVGDRLADLFGMSNTTTAVIFASIFILFGLILILLMAVTRMQRQQDLLLRRLAAAELAAQDARWARSGV